MVKQQRLSLREQITREAIRMIRANGGSCPVCDAVVADAAHHAEDCDLDLREQALDRLDRQ